MAISQCLLVASDVDKSQFMCNVHYAKGNGKFVMGIDVIPGCDPRKATPVDGPWPPGCA